MWNQRYSTVCIAVCGGLEKPGTALTSARVENKESKAYAWAVQRSSSCDVVLAG